MHRIALVEDHTRLAELIRQALGGAGIGTDVFHNLESAWLAVREVDYGALVIDRGLPDGDGLQLVKRLRNQRNAIPCLMMTARDALHDRVDGLDSGAAVSAGASATGATLRRTTVSSCTGEGADATG